jgi:hypothetical protein
MRSPLDKEAAYKAATTERPQLLLVGTSAARKAAVSVRQVAEDTI